jgi:Ca2+-binding EF-hand superfamily protein
MRAAIVLGLVAALFPVAAGAQSDGSKAAGSGRNVTKEQYMEQAKQRAAKRFDKLDANHDGVLSSDELKTGRRKKSSQE